jgi:cytochrome c oxidase subunit 2
MADVPAALPMHEVLRPAGAQAADIAHLWHLTLAVCAVVFAAVLATLAFALFTRGMRAGPAPPPPASGASDDSRAHRAVASAVTGSVLLLVFLLVASVLTDRAIARASAAGAVEIEVTGHQWWWAVRYPGAPSEVFETANEIHVPVGRPVTLHLRSQDVIHSLWAPSLQGKKDLIPGRESLLRFQADRPGVYRGQCAEFCGLEHATMAFDIVADAAPDYAAWAARQREGAAPDRASARGRTVFETSTCPVCHAVRGTPSAARVGPDLTHLAARRTIAAGTLPNDAASLRRWIRDPQAVKPGAQMPRSELPDSDLDALVAWLGTLR